MGIRIYCRNPKAPIPREVVIELICDLSHGFLKPTPKTYSSYEDALADGWLESRRGGGRQFIGPCCSKKKRR